MSESASLDLKNICKIQSTRLPLKIDKAWQQQKHELHGSVEQTVVLCKKM